MCVEMGGDVVEQDYFIDCVYRVLIEFPEREMGQRSSSVYFDVNFSLHTILK